MEVKVSISFASKVDCKLVLTENFRDNTHNFSVCSWTDRRFVFICRLTYKCKQNKEHAAVGQEHAGFEYNDRELSELPEKSRTSLQLPPTRREKFLLWYKKSGTAHKMHGICGPFSSRQSWEETLSFRPGWWIGKISLLCSKNSGKW